MTIAKYIVAIASLFSAAGFASAEKYKFVPLAPILDCTGAEVHGMNSFDVAVGSCVKKASGGAGDVGYAIKWVSGVGYRLPSLPTFENYSLGSAQAIGDDGVVYGVVKNPVTGDGKAVYWTDAGAFELPCPGGVNPVPLAVNSSGKVAGYCSFGKKLGVKAVYWTVDRQIEVLNGYPRDDGFGDASYAYGINSAGIIVGKSVNRPVSWLDGVPRDLGSLGSPIDSTVYAINENGNSVGTASYTGFPLARLWKSDEVVDLHFGPATSCPYSYAYGINDMDVIVGAACFGSGPAVAARWTGGSLVDINTFLTSKQKSSGWVLTAARVVNSKGSIAGNAYKSNPGRSQGFVLERIR